MSPIRNVNNIALLCVLLLALTTDAGGARNASSGLPYPFTSHAASSAPTFGAGGLLL
jgi:hypothetical protein